VGNILEPIDFTTEGLTLGGLNTTLINKTVTHPLYFHQAHRIPHPDYFDTHRVRVVGSLPYICESNWCIVWGSVVQFYVGEDSRFAEESVGI